MAKYNYKFYDGKYHNYETLRPECNSGKYFLVKGSPTRYSLINILVHGGRYDTYVLRNIKTGKIIFRRHCIEIVKEK